jgi:DNA-binding response OmpR family regulator
MRERIGTILVAEDEPSIRRLVQWALQDEGFDVDAVGDGAAAIDYLRKRRPALIVLDVMMPGADGYAVARALRALHGRATPILVLTAAGDAREAARRIGAEAYMSKPFELSGLIDRVRWLLDDRGRALVASGRAEDYADTAAG